MRIVRYITRDPDGNEVASVNAYVHHGRTVYSGAHILENPETGSVLTVNAKVVDEQVVGEIDLQRLFSPSARASIQAALNG